MAIGLQGSWTVSVASKDAAWPQRFRIEGSSNGVDDSYTGATSTPPVFVTGSQWGITVEHKPTGPVSWTPNRSRLANYRVSGGQFLFDIQTDDGGAGDQDFNDLVLTCAMPLSSSDWVVYGQVQTYSGFCIFNPCFPFPYLVIDTLPAFKRVVAFEPARNIVEKFYPDLVASVLKRPPNPPDPPWFSPVLLPTGLQDEPGLLVLGRLKDYFFPVCEVNPVAETLLRFLEYDRTAAELAGGGYTGTGVRETLGENATDEFGNYVFRFSRTLGELIAEAADIGIGESATTAALPDVIVQIMESLPAGVAFETAPPTVSTYTWEYRLDTESDWHFVNEPYSYLKQQSDSTWQSTPVGPFDTLLRVNGPADPKVTGPAYMNIEADPAWMITQRHRKIIFHTPTYQPGFGAVNFRIQGYDATGEKVPGATDTVKLLIDQNLSTGDVDYVQLVGGSDPGECALLDLPSAGAP